MTLLLGALLLGSSTSAGAHSWVEPETWSANHTLSQSAGISGNIVKVWQSALATRYGGWCFGAGCTTTPNISNGVFGPLTEFYTAAWQIDHSFAGLAVDGIAGPQTWNAARWFHVGAPTHSAGNWREYTYTDTYSGNPSSRIFGFDYFIPYGVWLAQYCGFTYEINHPVSSSGLYGYNCD